MRRLCPCSNSNIIGGAPLSVTFAVGMRLGALLVFGAVTLLALSAFTYRQVRHKPPILTIVPTSRPAIRRGPYGRIDATMAVGVTNNSQSSLLVGVGVASAKGADTFRSSSRDILELKPGCGTLWPVTYNNSLPKPQLLGADYLRIQSPSEKRARAILFRLGVPRIGTNDVWRSLVVGQAMYE